MVPGEAAAPVLSADLPPQAATRTTVASARTASLRDLVARMDTTLRRWPGGGAARGVDVRTGPGDRGGVSVLVGVFVDDVRPPAAGAAGNAGRARLQGLDLAGPHLAELDDDAVGAAEPFVGAIGDAALADHRGVVLFGDALRAAVGGHE